MKYLISVFVFLLVTQVFATTVDSVELGKYLAVPKEYPAASALLDLKADQTAIVNIQADDIKVNCVGTFSVVENILNSHVNCDHPQVPEVNVSINITNVTPENVRSEEGVEVPAKFDLMGEDEYIFILKKAD